MSDPEVIYESYGNKLIGAGASSSDSGGHTIIDSSGTSLAQESELQFADAFVEDDPTNGRTVIETIKEVSPADYDSTTDEGIIVCDDGDDALIGAVSDDYVEVIADGVKTYQTLMNELYDNPKFDATKINVDSYIFDGAHYYRFSATVYWSDVYGGYAFSMPVGNATYTDIETIILHDTNSTLVRGENGTITDLSSYAPPQYQVFRLYYGNKKATVDLQTTANRCLMFDGNTVENELSVIDVKESFTAESCVNSYKAYKYGKFVVLNVELKNQTYTDGNIIITSKQGVNFDTTPLFTISAQLVNASNKVVTNGCIWIQTTREHRYFGDTITGKMYFTAIYLIK